MPAEAQWSGQPSIRGPSEAFRMALLTASLIGLQFTWGIEMTYCTPYLLSLGLSKSATSLVWIAGPLSGLIMQPVIGVIADSSTSKWGRRRPFMVGGTAIVSLSLLVLGWTKEIVGIFAREPSAARDKWTIALAVLAIYATDFAINAVQASDRSLVVDALPVSKQQLGSAWATRMVAVGHLIGYGVGTIHLRDFWGDWLGDTQFKQMIWVAIVALAGTQGLTCWAVSERILISSRDDGKKGAFRTVIQIFKTTWNLPPRIQAICWVQFWAWIGWFPFLFYSPTWVGETYFRYSASPEAKNTTDKLGEIGRVGSLSLVIFSIVTFPGSILFPFLLRTPDKDEKKRKRRLRQSWDSTSEKQAWYAGIVADWKPFLERYQPDLLTAWMGGHVVFGLTMLFAPAVRSLAAATVLVSLCGIPWALTCWAPFAFLGEEVNRMTAPGTLEANGRRYTAVPGTEDGEYDAGGTRETDGLAGEDVGMRELAHDGAHMIPKTNMPDDEEDEDEDEPRSPTLLRLHHHHHHLRASSTTTLDLDAAGAGSTGETSGVYLGILNLYTTLPQFVGTFISTIVFAIFEPGKSKMLHGGGGDGEEDGGQEGGVGVGDGGEDGPNAIGICLFIGAVCALGAAVAARRLRRAQ